MRSLSFGGDAETYDLARPEYPDAAVDLVLAGSPTSALDVGCGTGKAALAVMARGVDVTGVEPDERMAKIARRHGVRVECTTFEGWEPTPHGCVLSAQAWHWVDADKGALKVAEVLATGGRWTGLWYRPDDAPLATALSAVYERFASHLVLEQSRAAETERRRLAVARRGLVATGCFDEIETYGFRWVEEMSVEELVRRLSTLSAHRMLEPAAARQVHEALTARLGGADNSAAVSYRMVALTATRR